MRPTTFESFERWKVKTPYDAQKAPAEWNRMLADTKLQAGTDRVTTENAKAYDPEQMQKLGDVERRNRATETENLIR